jgi:RES domain-containing protein
LTPGAPSRLDEASFEPPVRRVRWRATIRIIPSRYPPVDLFERVAGREDFEALFEVESLTNPRLRNELGLLHLVPPDERVHGPGSTFVLAPFTHLSPEGARFNDPTFGAYYAARDRATAVAESTHHRARFLARTREPPIELEMRVLEARLDARLHDLRGLQAYLAEVYDPVEYAAAQRFARGLRDLRSWGVAYDSVRREGGQCVAVFRPRALSGCRQAEHLIYVWDGARIAEVFEKRLYRP